MNFRWNIDLPFSCLFGAILLMSVGIKAQTPISKKNLAGGDLNTITTAVPFLMIAPDTRAGGMGDAGVASSPDANSIHWNASKLAFVEKKMALSVSYTPWLHALVNDINLAYLSGYYKAKKDLVFGGSLRYFSLGNIVFTDGTGAATGSFKPNEFAIDFAAAKKLGRKFSGGGAVRYIYSNLTGGTYVQSTGSTKAGNAFAVDINGYYQDKDIKIMGKKSIWSSGLNISNIGTKISYTSTSRADFIPINLRLGTNLTVNADEFNSISFLVDFNKLLVPTPPVYDATQPNKQVIVAGKDPNRSIAEGIFGSFNDAPGGGKEELKEIAYSLGMEYWYDKQFAFRMGYFHEDPTKGNRKFFAFGAGLKYRVFGLDFAYLVAKQNHPLANTLRFTLSFDFDAFKEQSSDAPATN